MLCRGQAHRAGQKSCDLLRSSSKEHVHAAAAELRSPVQGLCCSMDAPAEHTSLIEHSDTCKLLPEATECLPKDEKLWPVDDGC